MISSFFSANYSNKNRVITIQIHTDKTRFENVNITLLRRVAKDVTLSLLSWHKRYDFNAAKFRRHSQWKCALQTQWIGIPFIQLKQLTQVFKRNVIGSVSRNNVIMTHGNNRRFSYFIWCKGT